MVYLPFEDTKQVIELLCPFENFEFHYLLTRAMLRQNIPMLFANPYPDKGFKTIYTIALALSAMLVLSLPANLCNWAKKFWSSRYIRKWNKFPMPPPWNNLGYGHVMYDIEPP